MPKSKREPIPKHFRTLEEAGEFWDTHDLGDYWDQTEEVAMSFRSMKNAIDMGNPGEKSQVILPPPPPPREEFPEEVADLAGLSKVAEIARSRWRGSGRGVPWWRGHADESWCLAPWIFRPPLPGYENEEQRLFHRFRALARTRHPDCPPLDEYVSWLFLMQHHGLPTRLLDWTRSISIAAFFAVQDEQRADKSGAIWGLAPLQLNKAHGLGAAIPMGRDQAVYDECLSPAFDPKKNNLRSEKIIAIAADEVDNRMLIQQAEFTVHCSATPLDEREDLKGFYVKIKVPSHAKWHLKSQLTASGIRESYLFPDLDHLANDLRTEVLDLLRPPPEPWGG